MSNEERQAYETIIQKLKEAREVLEQSNNTLQKCNCETCFTPDETMDTEDMVWIESLGYVCEQCFEDGCRG